MMARAITLAASTITVSSCRISSKIPVTVFL
jgi:hypothetical protein